MLLIYPDLSRAFYIYLFVVPQCGTLWCHNMALYKTNPQAKIAAVRSLLVEKKKGLRIATEPQSLELRI